jgi:hypothetical protein
MIAHLVTTFKEKLHPQTDAEIGYSREDGILDGLDHVLFAQFLHPRPKSAHAGENDLLGTTQITGVLDNTNAFHAEVIQSVQNTPQIPGSVINDGQHTAQSSRLKQKPRLARGLRSTKAAMAASQASTRWVPRL